MRRIKYQTVKIDLPAGSSPQTFEFPETLDQAFEKCVGVTLIPIATNEDDVLRVGVKDDLDTHFNKIASDFYSIEKATPMNSRFHETDIKARGNRVTIMVEVSSELTARNAFDFVFKLVTGDYNGKQCPGACNR